MIVRENDIAPKTPYTTQRYRAKCCTKCLQTAVHTDFDETMLAMHRNNINKFNIFFVSVQCHMSSEYEKRSVPELFLYEKVTKIQK